MAKKKKPQPASGEPKTPRVQRTARALRSAPATGPLTLRQAQALAAAQLPSARLPSARAGFRAEASAARSRGDETPAAPALGEERARRKQQQEEEQRRRIVEYQAVMELLEARGVAFALPRGARTTRRRPPAEGLAAAGVRPLRILAEGDSWFDYPAFPVQGGVIPRLASRLGLPILNLAKAGDEVRMMLGVGERRELRRQLSEGSPAGGAWDLLLFSGGGNDIVGDPMALWVHPYRAGAPPAALLNQVRFRAMLSIVRAGYEDLIALRDQLSPETHLLFHGYDFAIPDGRGVCWLGPWLKPTFDLHGFPSVAAATPVVQEMLTQFGAMLGQLAASHPRVSVAPTQGVLPQRTASWHNELHPSNSGFTQIAGVFQQQVQALFPGRVQ